MKDWMDKKVIVLGAARQGTALSSYLVGQKARVVLTDLHGPEALSADALSLQERGVELCLGCHPMELLEGADLVCVSGGVPLNIPFLQEASRRGIKLSNDSQVFMEACPAPIVGITGSAGKTTTTALLGLMARLYYEMKNSPRRAWVGGNIGNPLIDQVAEMHEDDLVILELSSFQLELMTVSPPVAGVLNVTPNHLDRHGRMDAYIAAKSHIYAHQDARDVAVFGRDDPHARAMSADAPGRVAEFSLRERVLSGAYLYGDDLLVTVDDGAPGTVYEVVCARAAIRLRGDHNVLNTLAACALAGAARLPVKAMRAAIEAFTGVEHRLETVAVIGGVTWVNDSIATAPERVVAALHSYTEPIVLLAGGRDKNLPWAEMAALAATRCPVVICFGEYGPRVAEHMEQARLARPGALLERVEVVGDVEAAVARARALARPGDVVLLSPGGTSYDAYADFAERGQHFRELVRALGA